jgi:glycosyltransferase involved in cell wall biosynthesis
MRVIHHQRRPVGAQVSIERLFRSIRAALPAGVEARSAICPWPSKGLMPRLRNLLHARRVARQERTEGEGAVVHHVTGDVHYLALGLPRCGLVLTIHDCAPLHRLRGVRREVLRRCWYVWPVLRARVVTVISESTAADLRRWVPRRAWGNIRVVPNAVDPGFVAAPRVWVEGKPVFLQVGTGWNKNLERVVEALEGIPCELRVIGPLEPARLAALRGRGVEVTALGTLSDEEVCEAYRDCDAVIFVSEFEGFGMPVIEAQATGRPLITSDCEPMRSVAGEGALFADPFDVSSIREAVRRAIADAELREHLVEEGFRNVARYRPEAVAAAYVAAYRDALVEGSVPS